jgi:hypothetical protein
LGRVDVFWIGVLGSVDVFWIGVLGSVDVAVFENVISLD